MANHSLCILAFSALQSNFRFQLHLERIRAELREKYVLVIPTLESKDASSVQLIAAELEAMVISG